jgi:hypothetical protein
MNRPNEQLEGREFLKKATMAASIPGAEAKPCYHHLGVWHTVKLTIEGPSSIPMICPKGIPPEMPPGQTLEPGSLRYWSSSPLM